VSCLSVSLPDLATAKIRNLAGELREMMLLLPTMLMSERITGKPVGPYIVLSTWVNTCGLFGGSTIVSGPRPFAQNPPAVPSVLAAMMACVSVH
jgi:hypothetical protein